MRHPTSHDITRCSLNDQSIDTVIIHIGRNDLLTNSSRSGMDNLTSNIRDLQKNCLMFSVKNILFQAWFTPLRLTCLYMKGSIF